MTNIESIVRQINREFVPQFEEKLREHLATQDREWLIEQVIRLTLDTHSLEEMDRKHFKEEENQRRERAQSASMHWDSTIKNLPNFLSSIKA